MFHNTLKTLSYNFFKTCTLVQILTQKHEKLNTNFMSCGSYWCECTHEKSNEEFFVTTKSGESGEALSFMFPLLPNEILLQHT